MAIPTALTFHPQHSHLVTPSGAQVFSAAPALGAADQINLANQIPDMLFGDNPGIFLSGAPGSGKSNTMEVFLQQAVLSAVEAAILHIDPHGTNARRFYRWCLDQGKRVTSRLLYLHFANANLIPSIDVLHVPGNDVGSVAWYGRLACITELVSKILLAAWGETDFNSKPILFKNCYRIVYTLAHAGLPLADAELFLDVSDNNPFYAVLTRAVPDCIPTARSEMEELPDLRPQDRIAQLESFKNRMLGFLSNALVKSVLSRTAADGAFTMQQMYDDRLIVIVNLETGGVLRTMDQEILANILLSLAIYTAMNTPE